MPDLTPDDVLRERMNASHFVDVGDAVTKREIEANRQLLDAREALRCVSRDYHAPDLKNPQAGETVWVHVYGPGGEKMCARGRVARTAVSGGKVDVLTEVGRMSVDRAKLSAHPNAAKARACLPEHQEPSDA